MTDVLLIVNPFASSVTEQRVRSVEESLGRAGTVRTVLTERRGHATELAAAGADAVVVFGGDGAVNEVLNGLGEGVPLGALPGGGTSVFARALGLPRDPAAAAEQLAEAIAAGRTRRISLGRVDGRRFAFSAGVGFDAATVRRVDALGRAQDGKRPGDLTFAYELVRVLAAEHFRLEPALEVSGLGRAAAVFVANGDPYTYAGAIPLHIAPEARFELGLDLLAPVDGLGADAAAPRAQARDGQGAGDATACSTHTTSTGSRSPATGRCRSRPTARISATSSTW